MTRSDNRAARLRAALRFLDEQGGDSTRLDLWQTAKAPVPLEGQELEYKAALEPGNPPLITRLISLLS